jgi:hypothetical protein
VSAKLPVLFTDGPAQPPLTNSDGLCPDCVRSNELDYDLSGRIIAFARLRQLLQGLTVCPFHNQLSSPDIAFYRTLYEHLSDLPRSCTVISFQQTFERIIQ